MPTPETPLSRDGDLGLSSFYIRKTSSYRVRGEGTIEVLWPHIPTADNELVTQGPEKGSIMPKLHSKAWATG